MKKKSQTDVERVADVKAMIDSMHGLEEAKKNRPDAVKQMAPEPDEDQDIDSPEIVEKYPEANDGEDLDPQDTFDGCSHQDDSRYDDEEEETEESDNPAEESAEEEPKKQRKGLFSSMSQINYLQQIPTKKGARYGRR